MYWLGEENSHFTCKQGTKLCKEGWNIYSGALNGSLKGFIIKLDYVKLPLPILMEPPSEKHKFNFH